MRYQTGTAIAASKTSTRPIPSITSTMWASKPSLALACERRSCPVVFQEYRLSNGQVDRRPVRRLRDAGLRQRHQRPLIGMSAHRGRSGCESGLGDPEPSGSETVENPGAIEIAMTTATITAVSQRVSLH